MKAHPCWNGAWNTRILTIFIGILALGNVGVSAQAGRLPDDGTAPISMEDIGQVDDALRRSENQDMSSAISVALEKQQRLWDARFVELEHELLNEFARAQKDAEIHRNIRFWQAVGAISRMTRALVEEYENKSRGKENSEIELPTSKHTETRGIEVCATERGPCRIISLERLLRSAIAPSNDTDDRVVRKIISDTEALGKKYPNVKFLASSACIDRIERCFPAPVLAGSAGAVDGRPYDTPKYLEPALERITRFALTSKVCTKFGGTWGAGLCTLSVLALPDDYLNKLYSVVGAIGKKGAELYQAIRDLPSSVNFEERRRKRWAMDIETYRKKVGLNCESGLYCKYPLSGNGGDAPPWQ